MKKTLLKIFTLFLLFSLSKTYAQQNLTEGKIRYLITHNWVKKMEAVSYMSKQRKEKAAYMWGNDSEWKEYKNFYFNASKSKYDESPEKAQESENNYAWRKEIYMFYKDFAANKQTDNYKVAGTGYVVSDTIVKQKWVIGNDIKEVAGHICMNAFTEDPIKKHKITAWFAMDIPLSYGPEKFNGLPGLILEVDYNNGAMIISADKIEAKSVAADLELPAKMKGKKVKQAEIDKITEKTIKEKMANEEPWFWSIAY